jgi:hypothetical protein
MNVMSLKGQRPSFAWIRAHRAEENAAEIAANFVGGRLISLARRQLPSHGLLCR